MKKMLVVLMCLICLLALPQAAWAADVYYGDKLLCQAELSSDDPDVICVPVRQLFEGLGYDVEWSAEYNAVYLAHPRLGAVCLSLGDCKAKIGYYFDYELPSAPYFDNGLLYAPISVLKHEYCGYTVEWLPEEQRWLISDVEPKAVLPFSDLTREQLNGVTLHFGNKNSHIPIYTAELSEEDTGALLAKLQALAYREQPFRGEALEFSGSYGIVFDLHYADGRIVEFGFTGPYYEFVVGNDETVGYVPIDYSQKQEFENFYRQLKEKYLANVAVEDMGLL